MADLEEDVDEKTRKTRSLNVLCYFDDETRVVADSKCFALQKHSSTSAEGVELWVSRWYYTDIRSLLKNYLQKELRGVRLTKKVKPGIDDLLKTITMYEEKLLNMAKMIEERVPTEVVDEG
jgi:hypothetical protein